MRRVRFEQHQVLRDITLRVPRGQTLAIIGESGCGKTVLLKTIIGLVRPDARARCCSTARTWRELNDRQIARAAAAVRLRVPERGAVRQHDGRPERGLSAAPARLSPTVRRSSRWCSQRLAEVGLPDSVVTKKPAELSGGMRKRVGVARALVMNPEIMLYDEPTTGLDPIMSDVINELMMRARRHHPVTSVIVTHDMRTARKVADRVVMVYPARAARSRRTADHLRRSAERTGSHQGPPRAPVRARRGRRTIDGNAPGSQPAHRRIGSMDERQLRFRVGVVVLAAAVITSILISLVGAWPTLFKKQITMDVTYREAPGVTVDTPVRMSGIQVGRVSDIQLQDDGTVLVEMKIDQRYKIPTDRICRIGTGSLITGDAIIEWVPTRSRTNIPANIAFYNDQDHLDLTELPNESLQPDPLQMFVDFEGEIHTTMMAIGEASQAVREAGNEIKLIAQQFNRVLGKPVAADSTETQIEAILNETRLALRNINAVMSDIREISGDVQVKQQLGATIKRLPTIAENVETTLDVAESTLRQFGGVAVRFERIAANLEEVTGPLGERGESLAQDLANAVSNISELLDNLARLSKSLNNENGTIGQLINNPEMYERVLATVRKIEDLTYRLEPILNDVRILTHKVSTDPGQLGVRAILDPTPKGGGSRMQTDMPRMLPFR